MRAGECDSQKLFSNLCEISQKRRGSFSKVRVDRIVCVFGASGGAPEAVGRMPEQQIKEWLSQRITAILDRIDSDGRPPTVIEADGLGRAIDYVATGQLHLANRVLDELRRLTTMSPWKSYSFRPAGEILTTETLRARLVACNEGER